MLYALFILGFIFLVKGAEMLIEGASNIAKRLRISDIFIGLTIVAIGTSLPELVVNIGANLRHTPGLALGNIIGSNLTTLLFILGISAVLTPIVAKKEILNRSFPIAIGALILLYLFINNGLIPRLFGTLSLPESIILLLAFFGFLSLIYRKPGIKKESAKEEADIEQMSLYKSFVFIAIGLAGLMIGGNRVVDGAIEIAKIVGMNERTIGLTIVAIGTTLPELITSIVAIRKKKPDIALGNIIGSNITNILLILGINGIIHPIYVEGFAIQYDIMFLWISTLLVFIFFIRGKGTLRKKQGFIMIALYLLYNCYLLFFQS